MIDLIHEHCAIYGVEPICPVLPIAPSRIMPPIRASCRHGFGAMPL